MFATSTNSMCHMNAATKFSTGRAQSFSLALLRMVFVG